VRPLFLFVIFTAGCATLPEGVTLTDPLKPKDGKVGLLVFKQMKAAAWDFEGSVDDFVIAARSKAREMKQKNGVVGVLLAAFDYETTGHIRGLLFVPSKKPPQNAQTLIIPENMVAAITHLGDVELLTEKAEILREWIAQQNYRVVGPGRILFLRGEPQPLLELQYPVRPAK